MDLKDHPIPAPHLSLEQAAQSPVQPGLEGESHHVKKAKVPEQHEITKAAQQPEPREMEKQHLKLPFSKNTSHKALYANQQPSLLGDRNYTCPGCLHHNHLP